jgi:hypothetical protein
MNRPKPLRGTPAGLDCTTTPTPHTVPAGWRIGPRHACPICVGKIDRHWFGEFLAGEEAFTMKVRPAGKVHASDRVDGWMDGTCL